MMLDFVDYNFICDPNAYARQGAELAARPSSRIILTQGALPDHLTHPNMGLPYDNDSERDADCDDRTGRRRSSAQFLHYPDGNADDRARLDRSTRRRRTLQFTPYDPTKTQAESRASTTCTFGGSEVKGTFTIFKLQLRHGGRWRASA